MANPSPAVW